MENAERVRRLRMLVTVLSRIPDDHPSFYMGRWRMCDDQGKYPTGIGPDGALLECGTAACAVGYAALSPEFQALGLHFDPGAGLPMFRRRKLGGFTAVEAVFGITDDESEDLFLTGSYDVEDGDEVRPSHVIAKLERYIDLYAGADA